MVQIFPFRGLRYNSNQGHTLSEVTAPPYDVIDEAGQTALYQKHPFNIVRLDLNQETSEDTDANNKYTRAAHFLRTWEQEQVLAPDAQPAFYAYSQTWDGITRRGFFGLLKLASYESGQVMPHEFTLGGPKVDRMYLMKSTLASLSSIFMIYSDPKNQLGNWMTINETDPAAVQAVDADGVVHQMKPLTDAKQLETIQEVFQSQALLIADGHHRYETALSFKQEARQALKVKGLPEPADGELLSDYVLVFVTPLEDSGLKVYPTDRVLYHWPNGWDQPRFEQALLNIYQSVKNPEDADFSYQAAGQTEPWHLKLSQPGLVSHLPDGLNTLDVALLEETIFKGIFKQTGEALKASHRLGFYRDPAEVNRLLAAEEAVAVFRMGTPPLSLIRSVCEAGHRMPQKSTYFYPKLLTGLLLYSYTAFTHQAGHGLSGVLNQTQPLPQGLFDSKALQPSA